MASPKPRETSWDVCRDLSGLKQFCYRFFPLEDLAFWDVCRDLSGLKRKARASKLRDAHLWDVCRDLSGLKL